MLRIIAGGHELVQALNISVLTCKLLSLSNYVIYLLQNEICYLFSGRFFGKLIDFLVKSE